jgi:putative tricarboxylic transport membrane protein
MERPSSVTRDIAAYTVVLLVAAFLFGDALSIRTYPGTYLGPALWPEIILGLTIVTCVVALVARSYRLWQLTHGVQKPPSGTSRRSDELGERPAAAGVAVAASRRQWDPWIAAALTGAYVYLLPRMGYFLDTAIYVTVFIYLGNFRKLRIAALLGIGASFVFMIVFMKFVYISLPVGTGPFERVSAFMMAALGIH